MFHMKQGCLLMFVTSLLPFINFLWVNNLISYQLISNKWIAKCRRAMNNTVTSSEMAKRIEMKVLNFMPAKILRIVALL